MVNSVADSRLSDLQLAEDAAPEAFLRAYKRIARLSDVSAFPTWLAARIQLGIPGLFQDQCRVESGDLFRAVMFALFEPPANNAP